MNESGFWKRIKDGMRGRWHAVRVETSTSLGFPDVDFGIGFHRQGKIELKFLPEGPKRPTTKVRIPHFTPEQKLFFRERGPITGDIWLLIGVADETFLFDWKTALDVENHILEDWRRIARGYWKGSVNYVVMAKILIEG